MWNGLSDSDSDSDLDSDSESDSTVNVAPINVVTVNYEDKYIDDIKKMSIKYKFTWEDVKLFDDKYNELYNKYKVDLEKEKFEINQLIIEKSMKYIEIDEEYNEINSYEINSED